LDLQRQSGGLPGEHATAQPVHVVERGVTGEHAQAVRAAATGATDQQQRARLGQIVDALGYPMFFLGASLIGLPVLLLVHRAGRLLR